MATSENPTLYTNIEAVATAFVNSFVEAHKSKDIKHVSSMLSPSCRRYLAPASFIAQAPQFAAGWSNEEYEQRMESEIMQYSKVDVEIQDLMVDTRKKEAIVRSTHACTMAPDQRLWTFEFMFILRCDEDGKKIREIVEFVDTATAGQFVAAYHSQ